MARWVGERLGIADFGPCVAIGICDGVRPAWPADRNGRSCGPAVAVPDGPLIAGVVYNWYRQANIEMTIASTSPRWCSRSVLRGLFWYPFEQMGLHRVTAVTEHTFQSTRAFLDRIGFRDEGIMRRAYRNGNDAVIYGMLREECRWIGDKGSK